MLPDFCSVRWSRMVTPSAKLRLTPASEMTSSSTRRQRRARSLLSRAVTLRGRCGGGIFAFGRSEMMFASLLAGAEGGGCALKLAGCAAPGLGGVGLGSVLGVVGGAAA